MQTPTEGQAALEVGSPPAPAPSHQLPHSARPRPVLRSSFLPLTLLGKLRVRGDKCPPCLPASDQYRNLRGGDGASGGRYSPARRPPGRSPALAAGAFALASPCAARAAAPASPAPGLAMRFRRPEFRKSRQTARPAFAGLKFGGDGECPRAASAGEGPGVSSVRPAGSDSRHFQYRALPKAVRLAGCRRVSSSRRERWVGLGTAAPEPCSRWRIRTPQGRCGRPGLQTQTMPA